MQIQLNQDSLVHKLKAPQTPFQANEPFVTQQQITTRHYHLLSNSPDAAGGR